MLSTMELGRVSRQVTNKYIWSLKLPLTGILRSESHQDPNRNAGRPSGLWINLATQGNNPTSDSFPPSHHIHSKRRDVSAQHGFPLRSRPPRHPYQPQLVVPLDPRKASSFLRPIIVSMLTQVGFFVSVLVYGLYHFRQPAADRCP